MSLPSLKLPTHEVVLPFSKKTVEIKPYIIKEEGSILTMLNNKKNIDKESTKVFKRILDCCVVSEDFDYSELNLYDFLYLIMQIRMKSHGESITGMLKCEKCGKQTEFTINLDSAMAVSNEEKISQMVTINEDLMLEVVVPNIDIVIELAENQDDLNELEYSIRYVAGSISKVVYEEQIYKDFTPEELTENILNQLTQEQFEKIAKGMDELAKLTLSFDYTCYNCRETSHHVVENILDFF